MDFDFLHRFYDGASGACPDEDDCPDAYRWSCCGDFPDGLDFVPSQHVPRSQSQRTSALTATEDGNAMVPGGWSLFHVIERDPFVSWMRRYSQRLGTFNCSSGVWSQVKGRVPSRCHETARASARSVVLGLWTATCSAFDRHDIYRTT